MAIPESADEMEKIVVSRKDRNIQQILNKFCVPAKLGSGDPEIRCLSAIKREMKRQTPEYSTWMKVISSVYNKYWE